MSDRQSITTKKHQNLDSTFKVSPFQSRGFGVQQKVDESAPASKAELWENYQLAKQLSQKGVNASAPALPIQAKLTIGQPEDKYEQEADSMAAQVMQMPESGLANSNITNSVQTRSSIEPIQRACTECQDETKEDSKLEDESDLVQAKEEVGQTTEIIRTSAKITGLPIEPSIQRESPGSLPNVPNYQLTPPSLLEPADPSSRYKLGGDLTLHLDPELQASMQQVQEQVNPTIVRTALSQIKLTLPTANLSAPATTNPLATPATPPPTATPLGPAGAGPDKPRAASGSDIMDGVLGLQVVDNAVESIKTQASDRFTRDWHRLSTGEKFLGISSVVTIAGGALAGIIADPAARQLALGQLNGKVIPVPGLNWLHLEINTGGDNLMLGLHLDVGRLLPSGLGFKGSAPNAIGGVPEQQPLPIQRKMDSAADPASGSNLESQLNASKGGGSPLSDDVRSFMEPRFGADFSGVQVHTGSDAVQMNRDVNAQAFAHGSDIYFGAGKAPGKDALTAHELTHVVQQAGLQRKLTPNSAGLTNVLPNPLLQRQPAPVAAPPAAAPPAAAAPATLASYHNAVAIYAMTLNAFDTYAREQADWIDSPAPNELSVADKKSLRTILEFGRSPNILNGCGTMTVQSLKDKGVVPAVTVPLRTYSRAVAKAVPTVELQQTDDVSKGMDWGKALQKLEPALGGAVIQAIIKEDGSQTQLQNLIGANKVDALVKYNQICHPILHANNGAEITSFLALHDEGANPTSYHGRLPDVRNFHRFEKAALDRLIQNQINTRKAKPLALILHSPFDHNGAFHRDPNLTAAITDNHNLTLMLEGKSSLAEIQGELRPLARRYGKNNRISQVMIAGHGNARVMQLAGTLDRKTVNNPRTHGERDDAIDLDGNAKHTQAFFQALLKNMESGPNARIVLNACLTASNTVPEGLDPDPAKAQQQINQAIASKPSLTTHLQNMAAAQGVNVGVKGSNASFGQVGLIDPATGLLDIIPAGGVDPAMTADKFTYVREGREPEGAMRAVVECWAQDRSRCLQAVQDRHNAPYGAEWEEKIINAAYGITIANPTNANLMNQLAQTVGGLSELKHLDECRVGSIRRILPAAHLHTLFTSIATASIWTTQHHIPLVVYQVWQKTDNSKRADLLSQLQHFNCLQASTFIDTAFLGADLAQLLSLPPASPPPADRLKLALVHVVQGGTNVGDAGREYLRAVAGGGRTFPAALNINGLLAGRSTEQGVLQDIGLGSAAPARGAAGVPVAPAPNVDLDGDGTNDFYVEPMTRRGGVTVRSLRVRARPNTSSALLGGLVSGQGVFILGSVSNWYAIEFNHRTAFVYKPAVRLLRTQ